MRAITRLFLISGIAVLAQPNLLWAEEDKTVPAVRTDSPITLDGTLNEADWARAPVISDFHQVQPDEFAPASEPTEVRVLYDDKYLYIGARLHYSDMSLLTATVMTPRTRVFRDDRIYVVLDPFLSRRNGYLFESNIFGMQGDALIENNTQRINEWSGVWSVETSRDEQGWTAEFRIPFATVSFDPERDTWGLNVLRDIKKKQERMAWSSQGRQNVLAAPSAAGTISGLEGIQPGLGLDVVPSASVTTRRDFITGEEKTDFEPSLDVTYRLTQSLTAKLTLNTDFSATEVDDRQVNLGRFSLFFPEKRSFFLQDAGIFEFAALSGNGRPFFSRTIGLSDGEPLNLEYGAKVTGRVGRWNVGFLGVRQEDSSVLQAQDLYVARAVANVFDESSIGVLATQGDPTDGRDARTMGVDFRYRNSDWLGGQIVQGELWAQDTDNDDGLGETSAWGVHALFPNDRHYIDAYWYEYGENFDPAMGFANRTGIREAFGTWRVRQRPEGTVWLTRDIQVGFRDVKSTTDSELSRTLELIPFSGNTRAGDEWTVYFKRETEVLEEEFDLFDRLLVPAGDYDFNRYGARFESAFFRPFQVEAQLEVGDFYSGDRRRMELELTYRPSARFNISADMVSNRVRLGGEKFTARVFSLSSQVAFNKRWSLLPLLQFDNVSEELGINLRLRLHPSRGSDFYFVWSRNMLRDIDDRFRSQSNESVVKGTYTFRF